MTIKKITIAGLGLIGGSLAKALRRTNPDFEIIGMDKLKDNLILAQEDGAIDGAFDTVEEAVQDSQVVFLCTPVQSITKLLKSLAEVVKPGTIISDVGSTKLHIMKEVDRILPENVFFIGGHPMAGTERSGYSASMAHLFENAYYILTPHPGTPDSIIKTLKTLISSTGALPLVLDPLTHDRRVGAISHLPHIIAAALVNTVKQSDGPDQSVQKLAAGGFKDITRIASSNPEIWRDISLSNKDQLIPLLASMIEHLNRFSRALENSEASKLEGFYRDAKTYRDQLPALDSLYLLPYYEVYVDVEDKPGMIGLVATILGNQNINIKNIRIINSREDEPGCLVLSLADPTDQDQAIALLRQEGCRAYKR